MKKLSSINHIFFNRITLLKGNIWRATVPFVLPRSALTPKPTKILFPLNALHAGRTAFDLMTSAQIALRKLHCRYSRLCANKSPTCSRASNAIPQRARHLSRLGPSRFSVLQCAQAVPLGARPDSASANSGKKRPIRRRGSSRLKYPNRRV